MRFDPGSAHPAGVRLILPDGELEADSYLLMYVRGGEVAGRMAGRDRELVSMFASVARAAGGWAAVRGNADSLLALLAAAFMQGVAEAGGGRRGHGAEAQA
ncbi:MAG: hypothetical protein AB1816_18915 [Bacillota bacterium]